MFDTISPDLDIERNGFDLLMQEVLDLFYRSIDHVFNQINKPNSIGIKVNTSVAIVVLENFIWENKSLLG